MSPRHGSGIRTMLHVGLLVLVLSTLVPPTAYAQGDETPWITYVVTDDELATAHVFDLVPVGVFSASGRDGNTSVQVRYRLGPDTTLLAVVADDGTALPHVVTDSIVTTRVPAGMDVIEVRWRHDARAIDRVDLDLEQDTAESGSERFLVIDHASDHEVRVAGTTRLEGEAARSALDVVASRWPQPRTDTAEVHRVASDGAGTLTIAPPRVAGDAPWAILVVLVLLLTGGTYWAFRRVGKSLDVPGWKQKSMSWLEHLDELRKRLGTVALVLVLGSVLFFGFGFRWAQVGQIAGIRVALPYPWPTIYDNAAAQVFSWLAQRVIPPGVELIVTRPIDAVVTQMGLAFAMAFAVTFPVFFYQAYAFLAPGLFAKERRAVLTAIPFVVVLFVAGGAFGLLVMTPFMTEVLYGFAGSIRARTLLNVHELVSFAAVFTIMFGIAFQLPAVMALLTRIGLTTTSTYVTYWRHAVIVILIVAGIVTDPTLLSQLIVGAVLLLLYLLGLGLSYAMERRVVHLDDTG